jgi:septal ring-binding cell division protein DamX
MNIIKDVWQKLPKRHQLLLVVLSVLVLLLILRSLVTSPPEKSLALPPLPEVANPPPTATNQVPDTYRQDLRLADKRPVLASPGLTFVTSTPDKTNPVSGNPASDTAPPTRSTSFSMEAEKPVRVPAEKSISPEPQQHQQSSSIPKKRTATVGNRASDTKSGKLFAALPGDAWLLQVAAAPNQSEADRRCKSLILPCVSYEAKRNGRQLWILVVGPFSSRDEALAAVAKLPPALQHQGPFPRQIKAVRADAAGARNL